jgi:glycosyltransferase involved in cell wall biosynthesis
MARPVVVLEALAVRAMPTGVAGGIVELVRALAARDRGLDFVLIAGDGAAFNWLEGAPGWRVLGGGDNRAAAREWRRLAGVPRACRAYRASLLHALQPVAPPWAPCPVVLTVHDLAWRTMPEVVGQPRRSWLGVVVPPSLARARLLLANSQATADALSGNFPAHAAKVRVVPHGTPSWALKVSPAEQPAPSARPFFLFVGTLEPRKNLPRLLAAYEKLLAMTDGQAPDLVLAGPGGWSMGPLLERLSRPALQGRVTRRGWLPDVELRRLYATALALVFPSLDEGFGLPVLEAMACGLPVLTSGCGALAEVAGPDAILVDPRDVDDLARGMQRLAADPALRERLSVAGPARAAQWTWARTADLTTAAYAEITRTGAGR